MNISAGRNGPRGPSTPAMGSIAGLLDLIAIRAEHAPAHQRHERRNARARIHAHRDDRLLPEPGGGSPLAVSFDQIAGERRFAETFEQPGGDEGRSLGSHASSPCSTERFRHMFVSMRCASRTSLTPLAV